MGIEKRELMRYQYTDADLIQRMRVKAAFRCGSLLDPGRFSRSIFRTTLSPDAIDHR